MIKAISSSISIFCQLVKVLMSKKQRTFFSC